MLLLQLPNWALYCKHMDALNCGFPVSGAALFLCVGEGNRLQQEVGDIPISNDHRADNVVKRGVELLTVAPCGGRQNGGEIPPFCIGGEGF